MLKHLLTASLIALPVTANSALVERLGGLAYYDTEADLTWLADANAAAGSVYDTFDPGSGRMNWDDANAWAAGLIVAGVGGWRLPDTIDVGNDGATFTNIFQGVDFGYNITSHSELSNMFYNVLGNTANFDTSGVETGCTSPNFCLTNTGPFNNLQTYYYWSATVYAPSTIHAWVFSMQLGIQEFSPNFPNNYLYAWPVQSGDVGVVPVPAAVWLFGSGLIGLIGVARRKKS